ncbi:hypothetical protein HG530_011807 [Fusarium avenaceum]|nr:hypothetical protein HG530_011807 [Fusarium avenaceum]
MSSNSVIPIRYYKLQNEGVGILIYPEIRAPRIGHTEKLWDGKNHDGFEIGVDGSRTVDLTIVDMTPGTQFVLSEFTQFGKNSKDTSQVFSFDPTSTVTATAVRTGGLDDGSLAYTGIS